MSDEYDDRTSDGRMTDQPPMGTAGPEAGGFAPGHGVWQPVPHGEYDADQTMHVSFAAQLSMTEPGADPLAAPGHGYAPQPPQGPADFPVTVGTAGPAAPAPGDDPATTWAIPVVREERSDETADSGEYSVGAFASAPEPAPWSAGAAPQAPPAAPRSEGWSLPPDATGQWKLPLAPDGTAEESGEYRLPDTAPTSPAAAEPAHHDGPGDPGTDGAGDEPGTGEPATGESGDPHSEHPLASYVLNVNGTDRPVTDAWLGESLLYVLRERLGLAGAKDGCEQGECGACSVKVDGRLVASCLVPAATAAGSDVRTVEGLSADGRPSDVQRALAACGAVQCGFCIPGMAMTVHDLLEGNHRPSELETRQAISGNLCRCSGYQGVLEAVRTVVAEREEAAEAADGADGEPAAEAARVPHPRPSTGGQA
ncbi:2Fe-2S iron-sulfur cluster-binding protein [Streptomyces sp. NPDC002574]|uniref:2Fe-2S iron-sulfur cluster-binding protein n=1 Tax=Streptomyces sp. NPDC002574 TaxID=3364652 RepID=UPI00368A04E7